MSVMIKGSIMPLMCEECPCYDGSDYACNATGRGVIEYRYDGRPDNCPLVKIPTPHGRLVDADNLVKVLQNTLDNYPDNYNDEKTVAKLIVTVCKRYIESAPTVIESEHEKSESLKRKEFDEAIRAICQRFQEGIESIKKEVSE